MHDEERKKTERKNQGGGREAKKKDAEWKDALRADKVRIHLKQRENERERERKRGREKRKRRGFGFEGFIGYERNEGFRLQSREDAERKTKNGTREGKKRQKAD